MTHSNTLTDVFQVVYLASNNDAVTFRVSGNAISIREMDASSSFPHQAVNVLSGFANQVRMKRVAHFHRQSGRQRAILWKQFKKIIIEGHIASSSNS